LEYAVIGVPILWRDRIIGVFGLGSPPPRQFTAHDVEVLSLFAKHAAIAIENARLFARMQHALDELQLLYDTSRRIGQAMTIDDAIRVYLEQVAARGQYACSVALYEFNEVGQRTGVVVRGRWTPEERLVTHEEWLPDTRDALDPPLDAGQTVKITDVHTDPRVSHELRDIQTRSARPALAMIPLIVGTDRIGLVVLGYPSTYEWRDEDLRLYQATAAQLATAIDSLRQHLTVYRHGQQIAVFEERQRLAHELHDSVTQLIFSMTLIAQSIGSAWQRDPAEGEHRVNRLLELSRSALAEMRALLVELRPPETACLQRTRNRREQSRPPIV
jgi:GAF domain-containing protein